MKKLINLLKVSTTLAALFWFTTGDAKSKIGIVNYQDVYLNMKETQSADSALNDYFNFVSQKLQNDRYALEENLLQYTKDSGSLSPKERAKVEDKLRRDASELAILEQGAQSEYQLRKEKLNEPIKIKLDNAIQEVAKEEGFSIILYSDSAAYFLASDDITNKVKLKLGIKVK